MPPTCFMHIQKCGGQSLYAALEAALPPGSLAPRRMEAANFCSFDRFDELGEQARARVAVGESELMELARYRAVFGHFTMPTLLRLAPPERIATVLREPRARLLSYYVFLRTSVALRTMWAPYEVHQPASRPLVEFLAEKRLATQIDNRICRAAMFDDPCVRDGEFIGDGDVEALAAAAGDRLERLGFVGLLEEPEAAWRGVGALFGVELTPTRANVAGEGAISHGGLPIPAFGGLDALELLARRTRADLIVYRRFASRSTVDTAFAAALARYDSFTGTTEAAPPPAR